MTRERNAGPTDDAAHWEALARYLSGEAPPEEAAALERWIASSADRGALVAALDRSLGRLAAPPPAGLDVAAALRQVHERMDEPEVHALGDRRPPARERDSGRGRMMGLRAAAVIALLLLGGLVWRGIVSSGDSSPAAPLMAWTTEAGSTESVRLPDGSVVLLGPLSRLALEDGYGGAGRTVALSGEAMFEVVHREDSPFTVRAGAGVIQDLGTTFTVRSVDTDEVRVVVTEGTVRLQAAGASAAPGVILEAGDRGVLRGDGRALAEPAAATEADVAWMHGRLVFEEAPLARVRTELHRWYGIELRVDDPELAFSPLTTTFDQASRDEVLDLLALVYGATIEQRGDTAIMRGIPPR